MLPARATEAAAAVGPRDAGGLSHEAQQDRPAAEPEVDAGAGDAGGRTALRGAGGGEDRREERRGAERHPERDDGRAERARRSGCPSGQDGHPGGDGGEGRGAEGQRGQPIGDLGERDAAGRPRRRRRRGAGGWPAPAATAPACREANARNPPMATTEVRKPRPGGIAWRWMQPCRGLGSGAGARVSPTRARSTAASRRERPRRTRRRRSPPAPATHRAAARAPARGRGRASCSSAPRPSGSAARGRRVPRTTRRRRRPRHPEQHRSPTTTGRAFAEAVRSIATAPAVRRPTSSGRRPTVGEAARERPQDQRGDGEGAERQPGTSRVGAERAGDEGRQRVDRDPGGREVRQVRQGQPDEGGGEQPVGPVVGGQGGGAGRGGHAAMLGRPARPDMGRPTQVRPAVRAPSRTARRRHGRRRRS